MFLETKKEGEAQVQLEPWRKALLDGADAIERGGHCQGTLVAGSAMCARGALNFATTGNAVSFGPSVLSSKVAREADRRLADFLNLKQVGQYDDRVSGWNNTPGRTGAEVVNAMRACARQ